MASVHILSKKHDEVRLVWPYSPESALHVRTMYVRFWESDLENDQAKPGNVLKI
jgi:hypothetical protein